MPNEKMHTNTKTVQASLKINGDQIEKWCNIKWANIKMAQANGKLETKYKNGTPKLKNDDQIQKWCKRSFY